MPEWIPESWRKQQVEEEARASAGIGAGAGHAGGTGSNGGIGAATAALGAARDALSSTEAALARANTDAESVEEDSPAFTRLMDNSITPLLATMKKRQKAVDKAEKALRFALKKNDDADDEAETALRQHRHPRPPAMASSFVPFSALGMDDAFKLLVV